MTLKVKVDDPHFQYQPREPQGAHFMQIWWFLAQIFDEISRGQTEFPRILSQNGQMTLMVKVNDFNFQYQPRVSQDARLVQILWF